MKKQIVGWLTASLLVSSPAWAQRTVDQMLADEAKAAAEMTAKEDAARGWSEANPKMKHVGWAMVVIGGMMVIPWGTVVHLGDETYCVQASSTGAYVDVSRGGCGVDSVQLKIAAVTMGTGFVLAKLGGRHVAIKPTVTKTTQAVTGVVTW